MSIAFNTAYDEFLTAIFEYGRHNTSRLGSDFLAIIMNELPVDENEYYHLYHTGKLPVGYFNKFNSEKEANCYIKIWLQITEAYKELQNKYKKLDEPKIESAIVKLWQCRDPYLQLDTATGLQVYSSLQVWGGNRISSWYEIYLLDTSAEHLQQLGFTTEYIFYSHKSNKFLTLYANVFDPLKHFCNYASVDLDTYLMLLKCRWIKDLDYQLQTSKQWGISYTKHKLTPPAWNKLKITDEDITVA